MRSLLSTDWRERFSCSSISFSLLKVVIVPLRFCLALDAFNSRSFSSFFQNVSSTFALFNSSLKDATTSDQYC